MPAFAISGRNLLTAAVFAVEVRDTYAIRVRATDQGALFVEKSFIIGVKNVVGPGVETLGVESLRTSGATLRGEVNPRGASTTGGSSGGPTRRSRPRP